MRTPWPLWLTIQKESYLARSRRRPRCRAGQLRTIVDTEGLAAGEILGTAMSKLGSHGVRKEIRNQIRDHIKDDIYGRLGGELAQAMGPEVGSHIKKALERFGRKEKRA